MATLLSNPGCLTFKSSVANAGSLQASKAHRLPSTHSCQMPLVENRVAIRFSRRGRKKVPFFRIVAVDSRKRRDGRPLEELGWYDPLRKETNLNAPAIKKWLAVGAQPSETVGNLLKKAMVIE
ncbi:hypothetical protein WJX72_009969 [[Myrmecia] bisecta]|uniref:30S ribosomal protein S16, chloroplastic n=1 Tax=[Myrmecia] bisecta TaxID=41462 RepID=A0AAW1QSB1_9CHLO